MMVAVFRRRDIRPSQQLCEYFPSSGSGQVNVEFHVDG
jgi:3,4-dihydroxyphenylacetate 2,3-dioxygenase